MVHINNDVLRGRLGGAAEGIPGAANGKSRCRCSWDCAKGLPEDLELVPYHGAYLRRLRGQEGGPELRILGWQFHESLSFRLNDQNGSWGSYLGRLSKSKLRRRSF